MIYGNSEYNDVTPVGKMVLLKKVKPNLERHYGDIVVPYITNKNTAIGVAKIVKLGNKITDEDGIMVNDFVLYDYYSAILSRSSSSRSAITCVTFPLSIFKAFSFP